MNTVLGSRLGTGNGWAVTLKGAFPVYDQVEVTMFGDPDSVYIRGRIVGWKFSDGSYLSVEDAAIRGIR